MNFNPPFSQLTRLPHPGFSNTDWLLLPTGSKIYAMFEQDSFASTDPEVGCIEDSTVRNWYVHKNNMFAAQDMDLTMPGTLDKKPLSSKVALTKLAMTFLEQKQMQMSSRKNYFGFYFYYDDLKPIT